MKWRIQKDGLCRVVEVYGSYNMQGIGGHEYVVRRLSEELVVYGHAVLVLCSTLGRCLEKNRLNGVEYIKIPSLKISDRALLPLLSYLRPIVEALKCSELVHIHGPGNPFAFIVALVSKLMHKALVVTVLAYLDDFKHHDMEKRLLGLFTSMLQTLAVGVADVVHVENIYDAKKLHMHSDKVVIIPPGIEEDLITNMPQLGIIEKLRATIKHGDGRKVLLYLGRMHRAKGVDHAVKATTVLNSNGAHVKLVIAGPGNGLLKELRPLNDKDEIICLGSVTEEEKMALIDLADVVVIPSLSDVVEAYSLVASEAWARGKPVVAYGVGALKFRVKKGVNGYIAKAGDIGDLSNKIILALGMEQVSPPNDVRSWGRAAIDFQKLLYSTLQAPPNLHPSEKNALNEIDEVKG